MPLFGEPTEGIGIGSGANPSQSGSFPVNFWNDYLANPTGTVNVQIPGLPPNLSTAQVIQILESGQLGPAFDAVIESALRQAAEAEWQNLPESQRQSWSDAAAKGNPYDPDSDEGKLWNKEYEEKEEKKRIEADFEGIDEKEFADLEGLVNEAATGSKEALERLKAAVESYQNPELAEYVGDYISQAASAAASDEAIARQKGQFDKLNALSDPTITAEERLMMEMARRQQEQDLKAQRGAFANDLQARGVYGSGAELTMNLAAQQEAAQRRAFETMQAEANAQARAMDALGKASDLATTIRDTEFSEAESRGAAADRAAEWNKKFKSDYNTWVTNERRKNAQAPIDNAQAVLDATGEVGKTNVGNQNTLTTGKLQGTIAKNAAMGGMAAQIGGTQATAANLANVDEIEEDIKA